MAGRIAAPEAGAVTAADGRTARNWLARHPGLLIGCGYLAAAFALTWRLWAGLGTVSVAGDPGPADNDLMAWFMRYAADAVVHGHLPALVSTGLNAPRGFPLMWNNSVLFPAVLLAPVTLLGGPLVSLTVLTTLGYAGSAAAMYWLLRRQEASLAAGAIGGAVFGFSPGLLNAGMGHYGMQVAVLAPLLIEAAAAIVTGRGNPLAAGLRLGVLACAQLFTGEEMLAEVAIAGVLMLVVLAASRPAAIRVRLRPAAAGLVTGAATMLTLSGYALWRQFHGPLSEHGTPWKIASHGNPFGAFVNPQSQLLFRTAASAAYADSHLAQTAEYVGYLGPPLLLVVVAATLAYWRDLRIRTAAVVWALFELLSLGVTSPWMPMHWLLGVPLVGDSLPSRMSILADGAAAAVLAFGLDRALAQARQAPGLVRRTVPAAVALLAILPLVPRPVVAPASAALPAGWNAVFTRLDLPAGASAMIVPLPYSHQGETMLWQAETGQPAAMDAGWFLGPDASGHGDDAWYGPPFTQQTVHCLDGLWQGAAVNLARCAGPLRLALRYWHPAAVVADTRPGTSLGRLLTRVLGPASFGEGQLLAWRRG